MAMDVNSNLTAVEALKTVRTQPKAAGAPAAPTAKSLPQEEAATVALSRGERPPVPEALIRDADTAEAAVSETLALLAQQGPGATPLKGGPSLQMVMDLLR